MEATIHRFYEGRGPGPKKLARAPVEEGDGKTLTRLPKCSSEPIAPARSGHNSALSILPMSSLLTTFAYNRKGLASR